MPCTDIGQGSNPLRIISMRALPDQPGDKEYPREEWVGLDEKEIAARREQLDKDKAAGKDVDLDQSGDYVVRTFNSPRLFVCSLRSQNYEVAFSYQALPGQGKELQQKNIQYALIVPSC